MKNLVTLGIGLCLSSSALAQSELTSTKTGVKLPKILQDVKGGLATEYDGRWKPQNDYQTSLHKLTHTFSLSKPLAEKLSLSAYAYYFKVGTNDEASYDYATPEMYLDYGAVSAGPYSLSIGMGYTPKLDDDVAYTQIYAKNALKQSVSLSTGKLSLGASVLSHYLYQSDIVAGKDMTSFNLLKVGASFSPKALKALKVGLSASVLRSIKERTAELVISPRNAFSLSYAITDKLSFYSSTTQYRSAESGGTTTLRNVSSLSYSLF